MNILSFFYNGALQISSADNGRIITVNVFHGNYYFNDYEHKIIAMNIKNNEIDKQIVTYNTYLITLVIPVRL